MSPSAINVHANVVRCPACGQRYRFPFPKRCSLCEFDFGFERDSATGVDLTPYARAYAHGVSGWGRMAEWIWFASAGRLKHLTMMRASAASRKYAMNSILLAAFVITQVLAAHVGWRQVTASPALEPSGATTPTGRGWLHAASASDAVRATIPADGPVDLWWNPAQMIIGSVFAGLFALLLIWLVLVAVRKMVTFAHAPMYHTEQRMTAALHYSMAWAIPLIIGALFLTLTPLSYFGSIRAWPWYPSQGLLLLIACILAGIALSMWWFWLGRLGMTAPSDTRSRVVAALVGGAPLALGIAALIWWSGVRGLCRYVFASWNLNF